MAICLLSLGSNQGDRSTNLARALQSLRRLPRTRLKRVSQIYESSAIGPGRQRNYLNLCAEIKTGLSPMGLLVECKRIEAALGRRPGPRWGPRPADIDILFYGKGNTSAQPGRPGVRPAGRWNRHLILPHPLALKRKFVLIPLAELCPGWIPPVKPRRPVREWLARLNDPSQNVNLYANSFRTRR